MVCRGIRSRFEQVLKSGGKLPRSKKSNASRRPSALRTSKRGRRLAAIGVAAALSALGSPAQTPAPEPQDSTRPATVASHLRRGDEVEAKFSRFSERLEQAYVRLSGLLRETAPQLFEELKEKPPVKLRSGYQILPEILSDTRSQIKSARDFFHSYSWPRTEHLLKERSKRLAALSQAIETTAASIDPEAAQTGFAKLASDYKALRKDHALIESHIRHNRLWQEQIAKSPEVFERGTTLYKLAAERQDILDRQAGGDADPVLSERERALLAKIRDGQSRTWVPVYVRSRQQSAGVWEVTVRLYTDIEDEAFLREFRRIIESYWRYEDDEVRFQIKLSIQRVSAAGLQSRDFERRDSEFAASNGPAEGDQVDLNRHLSLFPADGAALTTGAEKIHTRGRFILLGPEAVAPRTLAHEFGHVLGFRDEYLRGYRDLGDDGYEILEASPDPDDIMCSSGTGAVLRRHFEQLIPR